MKNLVNLSEYSRSLGVFLDIIDGWDDVYYGEFYPTSVVRAFDMIYWCVVEDVIDD